MAFFFPSRTRHTRWPRDWSSDVCSSDLSRCDWGDRHIFTRRLVAFVTGTNYIYYYGLRISNHGRIYLRRSEERRVGKECRTGRLEGVWYAKRGTYVPSSTCRYIEQ